MRPGFVFEGFLNPVAIVGEVRKPGDYHLVSNLTVGRFLDAAGGLTPDADGFVVVFHFANNPPLTAPPRATLVALLRQGAALPQNLTISRIPIADYALNSSLRLEPQDILFVPSRSEV